MVALQALLLLSACLFVACAATADDSECYRCNCRAVYLSLFLVHDDLVKFEKTSDWSRDDVQIFVDKLFSHFRDLKFDDIAQAERLVKKGAILSHVVSLSSQLTTDKLLIQLREDRERLSIKDLQDVCSVQLCGFRSTRSGWLFRHFASPALILWAL